MYMHSRVNFHLGVFLRFADLPFSISSDSLEKSLVAMANLLDPVNWEAFGKAASKFHRDHPTIRIEDLTYEERLTTPGAKEAYAMQTRGLRKESIETNGCMPCTQCGLITASWCEACEGYNAPPSAICTRCDQGRVVCPKCVKAQRLWAEHQSTVAPNLMQIGGFQTEQGFVKLTPPLEMDVKDIPVVDGTFDWDFLQTRMHEHLEESLRRQAAAGSSQDVFPLDQFDL